jgi:hypothetical protein
VCSIIFAPDTWHLIVLCRVLCCVVLCCVVLCCVVLCCVVLCCVVLCRTGTLVELRQQIAVEKAMGTRLRAEIQEKDARITMMQISVAEARGSARASARESAFS